MKKFIAGVLAICALSLGGGNAHAQQAGSDRTYGMGYVTATSHTYDFWGRSVYRVQTRIQIQNDPEIRRNIKVNRRAYNSCQIGEMLNKTVKIRTNGQRTTTTTIYGCAN